MKRISILTTLVLFLTFSIASTPSEVNSSQDPDRGMGVRRANQGGEAHIALVIGNSAYQDAPLLNPANDARDIAAALRELGFDVTLQVDQNRDAMRRAIRAFGEKLRGGGVGLFYFAGHGVQVRGRNYLIPIGHAIQSEADVEDESVDAGMVLRQMEYAGNRLNIVILDACRNNPFARSFRSAERGLAAIDAPVGTLIAYATAPGSTASDGRGRNGLYTQELLANLRVPGLRVEDVFKRVRAGVRAKSKGQQVPWEASSIEGDFYFIPPKTAAVRPPVESDEQAAWEVVKNSRRVETVREFLDQYPNGRYAAAARLLLRELTPVETASNPPVEKKAADSLAGENTTTPAKTGARTGPGGVPLTSFSFTTVTVNRRGEVSAPRQEEAWGYTEMLPGAVPLEMVEIPGGMFQMGSPAGEKGRNDDEGPQHQVAVPGFFMGKYEVTQAQWRAVMRSNLSNFKGDNLPVEQVSWNEAVEFCARLSNATGRTYRLPTEAEWEYACRAGMSTPFGFGDTITPQLVNYDGNYPYGAAAKGTYRQQTIVVGSLGVANRFGLFDMHGNVWEWCADCGHESYYGAPTDGSSWEINCSQNHRVMRGGSWNSLAIFCRAASRRRLAPDERNYGGGFRVVCVARTR